jgi:hypothetical protein
MLSSLRVAWRRSIHTCLDARTLPSQIDSHPFRINYLDELLGPTISATVEPSTSNGRFASSSSVALPSVHLGHCDSLWAVSDFCNVLAYTNFSLLQDAKVKSWSSMRYEQRRHTRFIHANADAVARHARLRYFKYRITNAVSITDANLVIRKPFNCEVFPELAESKIVAVQKPLPVMVRIHLIDEYGALLPSVTLQIGLRITLNIEFAHHPPPSHWRFPD